MFLYMLLCMFFFLATRKLNVNIAVRFVAQQLLAIPLKQIKKPIKDFFKQENAKKHQILPDTNDTKIQSITHFIQP